MSETIKKSALPTPQQTVKLPACACGCAIARDANRLRLGKGVVSVMYECVDCGRYRL